MNNWIKAVPPAIGGNKGLIKLRVRNNLIARLPGEIGMWSRRCMYVCMYVCISKCMYVYMYVVCMYVCMYVYTCMDVWMYGCMCMCVCVVCVCVCRYMCVCGGFTSIVFSAARKPATARCGRQSPRRSTAIAGSPRTKVCGAYCKGNTTRISTHSHRVCTITS
jgi:hypothetical protein